jgi:uncharacterized membrane protein
MTALVPILPLGIVPAVFGLAGFAFWILLIWLVVALFRGMRPGVHDPGGPAMRLLEERYARGEISREDFVERRAVLGGRTPG